MDLGPTEEQKMIIKATRAFGTSLQSRCTMGGSLVSSNRDKVRTTASKANRRAGAAARLQALPTA